MSKGRVGRKEITYKAETKVKRVKGELSFCEVKRHKQVLKFISIKN